MKKKNIALLAATSFLAAPVLTLSLGAITSCTPLPSDDPGIELSTKDVEVDYDNGVGEFDIILSEQPIDNKVYVYIVTAEGPHHVELLDDTESIYHGHPAGLYDVHDAIAHVYIGFTEFIGESTKTVIGLQVRYNNRKGEWIQKNVYGLNLFTHYVHNDTELVHIFSLNDLHGVAEGYGEEGFKNTNYKDPGVIRLMNRISPIIQSSPGSFLVTAGDNNSGDMFSTSLHGESIYKVLSKMGARYSAVGNHAFDWGADPMTTKQFDHWARTPKTRGNYFLASNILNGVTTRENWVSDMSDPKYDECYTEWYNSCVPWADTYKIVNMNGHLICLIGLTTKAAAEDGNRSVTDHLSFIDYNPAVNYSVHRCFNEVGEKTFNAIESFILLTHVESDQSDSGEVTGDAADLASDISFEGVDAIISGHSHKTVDAVIENHITGKNILLGQAETEGRKYLDLSLTFDNTKPAGEKKLKNVSLDVVDCTNPKAWENNWTLAHNDMEAQKEMAKKDPINSEVLKTFNDEVYWMNKKLDQQIGQDEQGRGGATRTDSLKYPAVKHATIGHEYYINQRVEPDKDPADGGYICDQLGAWINYSNIVGFSKTYEDEILASPGGLTYPAISLINQDSIKIEYTDVPGQPGTPVKYKDMYDICGYENTTYFGYLSIWQLANVINHSLSGEQAFNYDDGVAEGWTQYYDGKTTAQDENNLAMFVESYKTVDGVQVPDKVIDVCRPAEFPTKDLYKTVKDCCCLYPCGPLQWYGFRFNVVPERTDKNGNFVHDRKWQVGLVATEDTELAKDHPYLPDIYIMDPLIDKDNVYSTIRQPDQWLSAEQYLKHHPDGMIPIVTNSFLYGGANWETPMVATYMKHNEGESPKGWPIIVYSHITRELMTRFTEVSATQEASKYPFDMSMYLTDWLVQYPGEPTPIQI